jgi:hypothetical protein
MAYNKTWGEEFSSGYERMARAQNEQSRGFMNDERTAEMPENQRFREQQQSDNMDERKRQFDQLMKYRYHALAARQQGIQDMFGMGMNGRSPQLLKLIQAKNNLAQSYGALNQDGTVDMSKFDAKGLNAYNNVQNMIIKMTVPANQINRFNAANALEKTLAGMDPAEVARLYKKYSGAGGILRYKQQRAASALGQQVDPDFTKYNNLMQSAELGSGQVRTFYGDSIQPEMMEKLTNMLNPSATLDAKTRFSNFLQVRKLLAMDIGSYWQNIVDGQDASKVKQLKEMEDNPEDQRLNPDTSSFLNYDKSGANTASSDLSVDGVMKTYGVSRADAQKIIDQAKGG